MACIRSASGSKEPRRVERIGSLMSSDNTLYEHAARDYARHSAVNAVNAAYERPAMYALAGDVSGKTVLDAGCAGGEYAAYFLEKGARVIAVDASRAMIDIVRERLGDAVDARTQDLNEPLAWLADKSVDLVVSSLTLHYLPSWENPLREFRRVLKPAGRFVMSMHHPAMTALSVDDYFQTTLIAEVWKICGHDRHVQFYHRPLQAVYDDFAAAGLRVRRIIEPRMTQRPQGLSDEWFARLGRRPWFLMIEAE